jgi:hypothetical protein
MEKVAERGTAVKFISFSAHCSRTAVFHPTDATGHHDFLQSEERKSSTKESRKMKK